MNSNVSIVGVRDFLERSGKLLVANPILLLPAVFYVLFDAVFDMLVFGEYVPPKDYFGTMIKSMGWSYSLLFSWAIDLLPSLLSAIAMGVTIRMVKEATEEDKTTVDTGIRTLKSSWLGLVIIKLLFKILIAFILFLPLILVGVFLFGPVKLLESQSLHAYVSEGGVVVALAMALLLLLWLLLFLATGVGLFKVYKRIWGEYAFMSLFLFATPSMVFEGLEAKRAIRRGAEISERMFGSMKKPPQKEDYTLFANFFSAWMIIWFVKILVKNNAATWIYLVTKPLFLAYGWVVWALFFILVWQKFGDGERP